MAGAPLSQVLRRHSLSDRQRAFVVACCDGGNPTLAAKAAGFDFPGAVTYLLRTPAVAAALHEAVQHALQAEAPVNLTVLRKIRDNEKAPAGVRADIAIKLMRLAGHVEPTKQDDGPQKQLSEMSGDELRAFIERNQAEIDRLEGELAARAQEVSAPASDPIESHTGTKLLDYLG